jgi:hypothetical protein
MSPSSAKCSGVTPAEYRSNFKPTQFVGIEREPEPEGFRIAS